MSDVTTKIRKGIKSPEKIPPFLLGIIGRREKFGVNVFKKEWDMLIILDACRYDLFSEFAPQHPIYEDFDSIGSCLSMGSSTPEWLRRNFWGASDQDLNDVFYVSGNGKFMKIREGRESGGAISAERLAGYHDVWEYGHNSTIHAVDPRAVTNAAIRAYRQRPNNRILVHYVQPHAPFIHSPDKYGASDGDTVAVWRQLREGSIDTNDVWNDYGQNLQTVLTHVKKIIGDIEGKIVVTSDHGNGFGRFGVYGHPSHIPLPSLRKVPWAVAYGKGQKKFEVKDDDDLMSSISQDGKISVEDHLRDLGYL